MNQTSLGIKVLGALPLFSEQKGQLMHEMMKF